MQKKIAIVNDISGFGRCSVTVALPILSAMGIQCGVVPTAVLSNHTEYPEYSILDFTPYMKEYIEKWHNLNLHFDGIYTGFLGSEQQLDYILEMLSEFQFPNRIVDPVMGDHGVIYDSYTKEMCSTMKELVSRSSLTTPNLTELCILTDHTYQTNLTEKEICAMCEELSLQGADVIVVTGLERETEIGNAIYHQGTFTVAYTRKILPLRPGTGDVFASILAGNSLHHMDLKKSVEMASQFICTCLETSAKWQIPINDGVCFEEHLDMLISSSSYHAPCNNAPHTPGK